MSKSGPNKTVQKARMKRATFAPRPVSDQVNDIIEAMRAGKLTSAEAAAAIAELQKRA